MRSADLAGRERGREVGRASRSGHEKSYKKLFCGLVLRQESRSVCSYEHEK